EGAHVQRRARRPFAYRDRSSGCRIEVEQSLLATDQNGTAGQAVHIQHVAYSRVRRGYTLRCWIEAEQAPPATDQHRATWQVVHDADEAHRVTDETTAPDAGL